ncbi:UNVERIFIED_CONTAM: hypothetical protein Sangu_0561200 [Sesamum angustifolium]|uniref:Nodulin-like domain-containing protein n=1 Tax=Sesamum angustifolium TaxID=2727405 RepID=A0AAW2QAL2_9LAMI
MEAGRWIAAAASIWIQCSCGASYAFGIYSPILKSSQGYDQSTLDTISVFKDIGANAGILSGLLYSAVCRRHHHSSVWGPWVVHAAGAVQCFVGYLFVWLAVTGAIPRPQVPVMCLFMFLAAHAQTFFNTANVVTAVQNFPDYSGTIVGLPWSEWSSAHSSVSDTICRGTNYFPPHACIASNSCFPCPYVFGASASRTISDHKLYLNGFSLISMIVAMYLMLLILLNNIFGLPQWSRALTLALLLILLSSPIYVAIKAQKRNFNHRLSQTSSTFKSPLMKKGSGSREPYNSENGIQQYKGTTSETSLDDVGEELNLLQAMKTLNFWLLFVAMLCGMGSGLATINNISQIGESLGYTPRERSTLVSLWSIWNFLGRFGAGYISDVLMHVKGWARPLFMTLTLAAMTAGHVIGSGFPGNLYVGSVLVGVGYGSQWSLMPTITSEIFGVQHMGLYSIPLP